MICDKCGVSFGNGIMMSSAWKNSGKINLCDFCYSIYKKSFKDAFKSGTDFNGLDEYHFRITFKKTKYNPSSRINR